ncbi:MAG: peptide ABC transporter substrate-binding protein [Dehalococcoidia bacterium]|nr:peptide ABC transporter substrate-binding protein [Dehalococcoidia bacterium]
MSNRTLPLMLGFVVVLLVAVVAVMAIAVLGGSDGDGDSNPASPGGSGDDGNGSQEGDGGDGNVSGEFCEAQHLITFGADPASALDPIQVRDEGTAEYIVEVFGGLVTLDLDLEVQPDLAEDWEISDDGTVYTFTLRDDIVFHNGRRVTAEDVKYSFERAADPANGSPTAPTYLGAIEGFDERFNDETDELSGVEVIDERTVQITLTQPRDWFLQELTYPVAFVVDQEQIEDNPRGWTQRPNGTGPFRVVEFTPAEQIILAANDRYHLGPPTLERVTFQLAGGSLLTRYENNEIHIAQVPAIELEAVQGGDSPLSEDYRPQPRMAFSYVAFNVDEPPFDDPNVRQAFAMSIDRERINDVLLFGTQRIADGILPPEMPGYDESVSTYDYDPEQARQLLEESEYAGSMPRVVLTFAGSAAGTSDILEAIQAGWQEDLGIQVELQAVDYATYLRETRLGSFQMYSAGWIADYPDPENFIDKLFAADSQQNDLGFEDQGVQDLIEQARNEQDTEVRHDLLTQAEQLIIDDAVVVPTFWPIDHTIVKPCVQGWPEVPMSVPRYRHMSIDPDAP